MGVTRWNIETIFFLSANGERRDVVFRAGVNIITGASGTGKSTLIKAIDYCLGASKCELAAHVRRRCIAVGVKWVNGDKEMLVGRIVPPVGQATSTEMFVKSGRELKLPSTIDEFDGRTNLSAAKRFLEQIFGIADVADVDETGKATGRATVRNVTPYLFVTKEVIYSETVLLHGLDDPEKAKDIVATMPYFLGVNDQATAILERRLRLLQRTLDRELARERVRDQAGSALKERALSLLSEARRLGLSGDPDANATEEQLVAELADVSKTSLEANVYPPDDELGLLHARRRDIMQAIGTARRQLEATRVALRDVSGFEAAVVRQQGKLLLAEHLRVEDIPHACPLCDAPSERGQKTAKALKQTLSVIRGEGAAVERVKPQFIEHDRAVEASIEKLNGDLRGVDDQIRTLLRQTQDREKTASLTQLRAHLLGRISYFQETLADHARQSAKDFSLIRAEIAELESRVDRDAKQIKLKRVERKVSDFASDAFAKLPTVSPCVGSEIDFTARQPEVRIVENGSDALLRLADVGSDQNYLAIHIALSFGLQRYFELVDAPVPGLLVLDQVSRPYFPSSGDDQDEREFDGKNVDEDEMAMRKHIDFLFEETARRRGMQVILIEHAYFVDDPRYVAATRQRWTRASGQALIPFGWPVRSDA